VVIPWNCKNKKKKQEKAVDFCLKKGLISAGQDKIVCQKSSFEYAVIRCLTA
jgi:hypothetical protein